MGLAGELASLRLESGGTYTAEQLQDRQRQYEWERGQVDYLGMDSFDHIRQHIEDVVTGKTQVTKTPDELPATDKADVPTDPDNKS